MTIALAALGAALGLAAAPILDTLATVVPHGPVEHPLPARRLVFAITGAALLAATMASFADSWALPAYVVLATGLLLLAVIDIERFLLPNRIVYPLTVTVAVLLALAAVIDGDAGAWFRGLLAAVVAGTAFAVLHLLSPSGLAAGDVKLAVVLGLATGWLGWGEVFLAFLLAFVLGALVAVVLVGFRRRGRRDPVPFGPFLAAGTLAAVLIGPELLDLYTGT